PPCATLVATSVGIPILALLRTQPRPTLYPYTTLFRSPEVLGLRLSGRGGETASPRAPPRAPGAARIRWPRGRLPLRLGRRRRRRDRKSTRLNSSHVKISYAVFCLKKKKTGPVPCPKTS